MMKTFYTYEDWTQEATPRCFYVGKGDADRVAKPQRNHQHARIAVDLGLDRRVVLTTEVETDALDLERRLIAERHTHPKDPQYNEIGCNRTLGGQGNSGRIVSEETCRKISLAKRGVPKSDFERQRISEGLRKPEVRKARSEARKGLKLSQEWKQHISDGLNDPSVKGPMIEKVTASIRAKYRDDPVFCQRIKETRARGEKRSISFTDADVRMMREEWDKLDRSVRGVTTSFCKRWAQLKNVTGETVFAIVTRKTWKHVQPTYMHGDQVDAETTTKDHQRVDRTSDGLIDGRSVGTLVSRS